MNVEFYKDAEGRWRWRFRARNGAVMADSGQGYRRFGDALNGFTLVTGYTQYALESTSVVGSVKTTTGTMWDDNGKIKMVILR